MKKSCLTLPILFSGILSFAQPAGPSISWQKSLGGSGNEMAYSMTRSTTGGYVIAGSSTSNDGDVSGHHGSLSVTDAWVVALAADQSILWQKSIGGSADEELDKIITTSDGGYIAVGYTASNDGDVSGNHGLRDVWVVKLSSSGSIQWQKCLGGTGMDFGKTIRQTSDGGYIIIGNAASANGDVTGNHSSSGYSYDAWVVKLDGSGALQWQKCYGTTGNDDGYDILPIDNGEYLLGVDNSDGTTDGDFAGKGAGNPPNGYLIKTDATGGIMQVQWLQSRSSGFGVQGANVQSYFVLKDLLNCYPMNPNAGFSISTYDSSLVASGTIPTDNFSYCPGPGPNSSVYGYRASGSGSMVLLGNNSGVVAATTSDTTSLNNHGGATDGYLGNYARHTWGKCYGGSGVDYFTALTSTDDYTFIAAGYSNSNDGDVSGNHGGFDFWVVKLSNFNTVRGVVYMDYNKNGIKESNEPLVSGLLVQSNMGGSLSGSLTNNGIFNNVVDTGSCTTSVITAVPNYTVVPATHSSTFHTYNNTDSFSFALQPVPGKRDYHIALYTLNPARPGYAGAYGMTIVNVGTDTLKNRIAQLIKDPRLQFVSATPAPLSVSGDTLRWNISSLSPRDTASIQLTMKPGVPPAVNLFDTLSSSACIDSTGDINPADNFSILKQIVKSSYDPNEKTEASEGRILADDLARGRYLQYTIRFQNTGTDTAFNIVVNDTLSAKVDVSTFEMIGASNPYRLTLKNGNILSWAFAGVDLPDSNRNEPGSHGYILYRIKPKATITAPDTIRNSAAIYFDFNLPVATNVQQTAIVARPIQVILPPPAPQISGLHPGYCNNAGVQSVSITNMPAPADSIVVTAKVDQGSAAVGTDGRVSIRLDTLAGGIDHYLSVVFSNAGGADTTVQRFYVDSAVSAVVRLNSDIQTVRGSSQQVNLTATAIRGGGSQPLYLFSKDAGGTQVIQAQSPVNTISLNGASLAIGDNKIYVRLTTSDTCYLIPSSLDSIIIVRIADAVTVTPPPAPKIAGLKAGYCSNAGAQAITVANYPAPADSTTVSAKLDRQILTVGADGTLSLPLDGLSAGIHSLSVVFSNKAGADTTVQSFVIYTAINPVVKLSSNSMVISGSTQQVTLTALAISGGGDQPVFSFAKDPSFTMLVQAESAENSLSLSAASLNIGNNPFYVRMKISDSCSGTLSAVDSIVLVHNPTAGGLTDPDYPGTPIGVGPNPFDGKLNITGLQTGKSYGISLVNRDGREISFLQVKGQQQATLMTGGLNQGIYFLRIYDETKGRVIGSVVVLSSYHQ